MEHRTSLEVIAPTVHEAIEKGLVELGLEDTQVDVEVLDEGGTGFLGLGGRQARVRLIVKEGLAKPAAATPAAPRRSRPAAEPSAPLTEAEAENLLAITKATVLTLLEHMSVRADVSVSLGEPDEPDMAAPVLVDIQGGDLGFLIGRQAETMGALQLITRLIVGKEVGRAAHIIIDVAGYRQRRDENLRKLAHKMAKQAVSTGRRQTLEPMSPSERRIIHLELRDSAEVTTESTGEEPRRKVVITPK
ncbi:MAG: Jag N-terminal domain-containing protein [Anaerolineales bacterium]|nr:MAG: Jag N-terminal domain-containing protein [Anaerolineales bacterium]